MKKSYNSVAAKQSSSGLGGIFGWLTKSSASVTPDIPSIRSVSVKEDSSIHVSLHESLIVLINMSCTVVMKVTLFGSLRILVLYGKSRLALELWVFFLK